MKIKYILTLVMALFASSLLKASPTPTVVITQNSYSSGIGGEFTASTEDYLGSTSSFETFCIQTTIDLTPNTVYHYSLAQSDSLGQPLTLGTAYLFSQFALGDLQGYDYSLDSNRQTDAGMLQQAIWYLQGGQTIDNITPTVENNPFYADAINALGTLASDSNNNIYNVDVMRLTGDYGTPIQNQLEYMGDGITSVPEPSSVLALASLGGLFTMIIIRKRNYN